MHIQNIFWLFSFTRRREWVASSLDLKQKNGQTVKLNFHFKLSKGSEDRRRSWNSHSNRRASTCSRIRNLKAIKMDHRVFRFATRGQCTKWKKLNCFEDNHRFCFKLQYARIVVLLCTAIWLKLKDVVVHYV